MRTQHRGGTWVVYQMTLAGIPGGRAAVCHQAEWDEMEARQPGFHSLIRAGITNEGEAEQVARAAGYDAAKSKRW
jgi:hypothetical protein